MQILGPQATEAMSQMLRPYDEKQFQGLFQKAFIDPAMMTYNQEILPAIRESAVSQNAGSSGSLNQALAASAQDLATGLGTQMGQFFQEQQGNQKDIMGILAQMLGMKPYENIASQNKSPFQQTLGAASAATPWWMGRKWGK